MFTIPARLCTSIGAQLQYEFAGHGPFVVASAHVVHHPAGGVDKDGQRSNGVIAGERIAHTGDWHRHHRRRLRRVDVQDIDAEPEHDAVCRLDIEVAFYLIRHSSRSTTVESSEPDSTYSSAFCRWRLHSSPALSASPALIRSSTIRWVLDERRAACSARAPVLG